jgi:hypothetical protein
MAFKFRTKRPSQHEQFIPQSDLSSALKGDGLGVSEKVKPTQVVDFGPCAFQQFGAVNHDGEALRTADSDVKSVRVE